MTAPLHTSRLLGTECDPKRCGSDVLAFVGDGVFGLLVREYLVSCSNAHAQAALAPRRSLVSLVPSMMISRSTGSWLIRQE